LHRLQRLRGRLPAEHPAYVKLSQLIQDDCGFRWYASFAVAPQTCRQCRRPNSALTAERCSDETTRIRCAMRFPLSTHAVTMMQFEFYRECVSVPAPNLRINYGP
jgi:hypothetical protein